MLKNMYFKDLNSGVKKLLLKEFPFLKDNKDILFSEYPTKEIFYVNYLYINGKIEIIYSSKCLEDVYYDPFWGKTIRKTSSGVKSGIKDKILKKAITTECCVFNAAAPVMEKSISVSNMAINFEEPSFLGSGDSFDPINYNDFLLVRNNPLSTFAADVDTASYTNFRSILSKSYFYRNSIPNYRLEEFINYFDYNYEKPEDKAFSVTSKIVDTPWNKNSKLLILGLQAKEMEYEETPASNLVFLIDVSGSMGGKDKLDLLKETFKIFVDKLSKKDKISIVTYSGKEEVVLEGASGNDKKMILDKIDKLYASGCTNGEAGLKMAYELAEKHFIKNGNNRIIMCSDGDLNVGMTSRDELHNFVMEKKKGGVYLTVLGFGYGNYKDDKMIQLADNGNGNYYYIDSLIEGKKVLVDKICSTLVTMADDVKFQVEFNPKFINKYKLVGYEKKKLNAEDFKDDSKDGGDIGYGHSVTVVYELILNDSEEAEKAIKLKYQNTSVKKSDEWMTVKIRYKDKELNDYIEIEEIIDENNYLSDYKNDENASFILGVIAFSLMINDLKYKDKIKIDDVINLLMNSKLYDLYKAEFLALVYKYDMFIKKQDKIEE